MNAIVDAILRFFLKIIPSPEAVTLIVAALPIVEARLALPIGLGLGIKSWLSWLLAFVGSTILAPILLLVLIPFIRFLARTRLFRKLGSALYDRIEKKSRSVSSGDDDAPDGKKRRLSPEAKKMIGVYLFVAVPMPLTGVWTGCAVASITGLKYPKALVSVAAGNLTASLILWLLCACFAAYVNYIILTISIIAVAVVIALIIKIIVYKPAAGTDGQPKPEENTGDPPRRD